MASNKTGMTEQKRQPERKLGRTLIAIVAAGAGGGVALITTAKKLGEKILELQQRRYERLERLRELERENVKRIIQAESFETDEEE